MRRKSGSGQSGKNKTDHPRDGCRSHPYFSPRETRKPWGVSRLRERVLECAVDGRLSCADAHFIAEEADVPLETVGRVCNREEPRIKITACRLGCF